MKKKKINAFALFTIGLVFLFIGGLGEQFGGLIDTILAGFALFGIVMIFYAIFQSIQTLWHKIKKNKRIG